MFNNEKDNPKTGKEKSIIRAFFVVQILELHWTALAGRNN